MIFEILIACVTLLLLIIWNANRSPSKNFPPGPFRFPIMGTLPLMAKSPLETLLKWKRTYGPVVGIKLASYDTIIINDYKGIKEAFNESSFSGRPSFNFLLKLAGGKKRGLAPNDGHGWVEQRRFALKNLRDFGFGKKSMEGVIQDDITELVSNFRQDASTHEPIDISRKFNIFILASLWNIIAGEKMNLKDPKFQMILDKITKLISSLNPSGPAIFSPWVQKLFPELSGMNLVENTVKEAHQFMREIIESHQEKFDQNNPRDFIDMYLLEMDKTSDDESSFYKEEGVKNLIVTLLNMFGAGAEPTSNTITWALLLLATNEEVQKKLQAEIDSVVGNSRLPSLEDKPLMPYTEAVMLEVFRYSSSVPIGIFHNTMEPVEFLGYSIPKDTVVLANLYGLHHDPEIWGDPENFRPERHLDENGKKKTETPAIIPFSVGRRSCPGETLARIEFFLFLTSLCQAFTFTPDPSIKDPKVEANFTVIRKPNAFKLLIQPRHV